MLGYPPTPPPLGSPAADRPTLQPPRFGSPKGGEGPPPHSPQNDRTPLRVTHWLVAAPVGVGQPNLPGNVRSCSGYAANSTPSFQGV